MGQTQSTVRWHILFEGEVQFVGFRYTARLLAQKLRLTGWVKNLDDGRVEGNVSLTDKAAFAESESSSPKAHDE